MTHYVTHLLTILTRGTYLKGKNRSLMFEIKKKIKMQQKIVYHIF